MTCLSVFDEHEGKICEEKKIKIFSLSKLIVCVIENFVCKNLNILPDLNI